MRIASATQGTAEWHQARLGICRGSEMAAALGRLKVKSKNGVAGDYNGEHWNLVRDLAWEHILQIPTGHHVTKPMEIGTQYEPEARVEFWMRYGAEVEQTGFVLHPELNFLGASCDGYVIENGTAIPIELKVPTEPVFKKYLDEPTAVPEEYVAQVMTEMLCFDRAPYGYFAAYCPPDILPEMPDHMRMFRVKLMADLEMFTKIEECAKDTMQHVFTKIEQLQRMYPAKGAPKSKFRAELETAVLAQEIAAPPEDNLQDPAWDFLDHSLAGVP